MRKLVLLMTAFLLLMGLEARAGVFNVRSVDPDHVYVYAFKGSGDDKVENYGVWPGIPLTTPSLGTFDSATGIYTFSESTGATIIFNNGLNGLGQTGDLAPGNYNLIYPKPDGYSNYNWSQYETLWFDYTIVGAEALTGADWSPAQTANDMTPQNGIYTLEKTVELNQGSYEYKVVANHDWGLFEEPQQGNQTLPITEAGKYNVTFTFNPATRTLTATAELIPVVIDNYTMAGDAALMGTETDGAIVDANNMTENNGVWTLVKNNVELVAGTYNYKVVGNQDPTVYEKTGSLTVDKHAIYNVTFTFDPTTEDLSLEVVKVRDIYKLHYGTDAAGWSNPDPQFTLNEDGKLVLTINNFKANDNFLVYEGNNWYGAAPDADNRVDYFNCTGIALSNDQYKQNFYIPEAGDYTFELTVGENGITLDVKPFAKPTMYLQYGKDGDKGWQNVAFDENLKATIEGFKAGDEFIIHYGRYYYAAAQGADNVVDYFNHENITLSDANNHQNFRIDEAGDYSFELTLNAQGYPDKISVQPFTKPAYELSYGEQGQNWTDVETFTQGEGGKLVVRDVVFSAGDEFVINYGRYKYSSEAAGEYWLVDREHCTNLSLIRDGKNFRFDEAGTYTFEMTLDENGFPATLNVTGFTPPVYKLSYGVPNQNWNEVTFEENEGGKLVATVNSFPADNEFLVIYCEGNNKVYYGAASGADNLVDYFNSQISLVTEGHLNLHINDAGNYTFELSFGENNAMNLKVQPFTQPDYVLSYGEEGNVTFTAGEGENEGKLVAKDVEFSAGDEFVINYGRFKYGSEAEGAYWLVDREHCTDLNLIRDGKNFRFDEAGTYTFVMTLNENGFPATLTVEGFTELPYVLHYSKDGLWLDVNFVDGTGVNEGKLVAADVEFAAETEFGVKYGDIWYAGDVGTTQDTHYGIHADHHTGIVLKTANEATNLKNFYIAAAGTYTFILTIGETGITMDVEGFPAPAVVGDLDGDGKADVTDVNIMVNMILGKQAKTPAADLDNSGDVDVTDVNLLVNIILGKGTTTE